jgi:hypothetical protein
MWAGYQKGGGGALSRTGPHSAIKKPVSPETNSGVLEGYKNPHWENQYMSAPTHNATATCPPPYTKKE